MPSSCVGRDPKIAQHGILDDTIPIHIATCSNDTTKFKNKRGDFKKIVQGFPSKRSSVPLIRNKYLEKILIKQITDLNFDYFWRNAQFIDRVTY